MILTCFDRAVFRIPTPWERRAPARQQYATMLNRCLTLEFREQSGKLFPVDDRVEHDGNNKYAAQPQRERLSHPHDNIQGYQKSCYSRKDKCSNCKRSWSEFWGCVHRLSSIINCKNDCSPYSTYCTQGTSAILKGL